MLILNVYGTIDSGYWYIRLVLQDHLTVLAIVTLANTITWVAILRKSLNMAMFCS